MLVFRSFAIGLSAACFALLVMRPSVVVMHDLPQIQTPPSIERTRPAQPPTIVDAAPGITPEQLELAIRLAPGERISSIDRSQQFIDLDVSGPAGERRVLVLLH